MLELQSQKKQGGYLASKLNGRLFEYADGFHVIVLLQHDLYYLRLLRRYDLSDEIRLDRKLAVFAAAIDQDGELNFLRAAKIHQLIHSRTDRSPGVENVVDEYNDLSFYIVI